MSQPKNVVSGFGEIAEQCWIIMEIRTKSKMDARVKDSKRRRSATGERNCVMLLILNCQVH